MTPRENEVPHFLLMTHVMKVHSFKRQQYQVSFSYIVLETFFSFSVFFTDISLFLSLIVEVTLPDLMIYSLSNPGDTTR